MSINPAVEEQMEKLRDLIVGHVPEARIRNILLQLIRQQFEIIFEQGALHGLQEARKIYAPK